MSQIKSIALLLLVLVSLLGCRVSVAAQEPSVERWGVFELRITGPKTGNPFIEVEFGATFEQAGVSIAVEGFYDGDGVYVIRFMPEQTGQWRYTTYSNHALLSNKQGAFNATKPQANNHGPVRVANKFHFAYADGTPYFPIGTTSYTWSHRPKALEDQTLNTLSKSPFNKLRMCVFPQTFGTKTLPPSRFPFMGPPKKPDYTRFNPDFFRHLEKRVGQLMNLGIEADLILFHPYDDDKVWGLENMPADVEERYLRYIVARLGAYRNVWWSLANEFDFLKQKSVAQWDENFKTLVTYDPYGHLRSIHNGKRFYDHNKPWVTHASIQNGYAVTAPGTAQIYRDVYEKPVIYDEVEYEGNHTSRWAQLSGQELVHRFWSGTVVGTYVGHSEFITTPGKKNDYVWLGQGGDLKGSSVPRIAFLKTLLEQGPSEGINPIDKWWNPNIGGKPDEYYLIYFGKEKPRQWVFELKGKFITEGGRYKVDIIDTWDMTINTVANDFKVVKYDKYTYRDINHKIVNLPGKPGMALRIQRQSF